MDRKLKSRSLPFERQDYVDIQDENLSNPVSDALEEFETPEHWYLERPGWEYDESRSDLEQWILTGALTAESILTQKGINPEERKFMAGYDYDGPINTPHNDSMEAPEGFHEAGETLPVHEDWLGEVVISGRDMDYLWNAVNGSIGLDVDLAGQHGAVYMPARGPGSTAPEDWESDIEFLEENPDSDFGATYEKYTVPEWDERIQFESSARRKAAEENRKLIWATSRSPVAGTLSVEGEGVNLNEERTGVWNNTYFSENYSGTDVSQLYGTIEDTAEDFDMEHTFEQDGDKLRYTPTSENEEILSHALSVEEPFTELRFDTEDEAITLEVDHEAEEEYDLADAERFVKSVKETVEEEYGTEFGYDRNPDWWLDYYLKSDISKGKAAQAILEKQPVIEEPSDALMVYTGDRKGDVLMQENALNYVQIGEDSHRHSYENDIPAVLTNESTDYRLMNAELFRRNNETQDVEQI